MMIKVNKKSIISIFLILSALLGASSVLFAPIQASAATYSGYTPPTNPVNTSEYSGSGTTNTNQTSGTNTTGSSTTTTTSGSTVQQVPSNAAPLIYTTVPESIKVGSVGIQISVIGSNFMPSSVVRWNGVDRTTTFVNGTQLSVKLNDADIAQLGQFPITVFTPAPGGGISNLVTFTVDMTSPSVVVAPTNTVTTPTNTETSTTTVTSTTDTSKTKLTANASGGSFVWNLMYWLFLSILILIAIILWRKHYLKKKKEELELEEDEELPLKRP